VDLKIGIKKKMCEQEVEQENTLMLHYSLSEKLLKKMKWKKNNLLKKLEDLN